MDLWKQGNTYNLPIPIPMHISPKLNLRAIGKPRIYPENKNEMVNLQGFILTFEMNFSVAMERVTTMECSKIATKKVESIGHWSFIPPC